MGSPYTIDGVSEIGPINPSESGNDSYIIFTPVAAVGNPDVDLYIGYDAYDGTAGFKVRRVGPDLVGVDSVTVPGVLYNHALAATNDGGFAVIEPYFNGINTTINVHMFDVDGIEKSGSPFAAGTLPGTVQYINAVTRSEGGILVIWQAFSGGPGYAAKLDNDGAVQSSYSLSNGHGAGMFVQVSTGYAVTLTNVIGDYPDTISEIKLQFYDDDLELDGSNRTIETSELGYFEAARSIAALADGSVAISWMHTKLIPLSGTIYNLPQYTYWIGRYDRTSVLRRSKLGTGIDLISTQGDGFSLTRGDETLSIASSINFRKISRNGAPDGPVFTFSAHDGFPPVNNNNLIELENGDIVIVAHSADTVFTLAGNAEESDRMAIVDSYFTMQRFNPGSVDLPPANIIVTRTM